MSLKSHHFELVMIVRVHVDIFDDRKSIYSPGGMADGSIIQNQKLSEVSSKRCNPVLADVFARLGYMERQGSGLEKIIEWYQVCANYTEEKTPTFSSTSSQFIVTLPNLNYGNKTVLSKKTQDFNIGKTGLLDEKQDYEDLINTLSLTTPTYQNIMVLFNQFGYSKPFTRSDIIAVCGITKSPASTLLNLMKQLNLIIPTNKRYGQYIFQNLWQR